MFQNLIFNAPKSSYTKNQVFLYELKKQLVNKKKTIKIPFMWIKNQQQSKNLFFYFHANSTDIGQCVTLAENIANYFDTHVILMEYRGYGMYKKKSASEKKIYKDAEYICKFVIKELKFKPKNINVIGRSLGSSIAIHLCQKFQLGSLILISPFLSIRKVVKDKIGFLCFLVKDIMNNEKKISNVKCPVLIIHGKKDKMVKLYQAKQLFELIKTQKRLSINKEMTHNHFCWYEDIFEKIDKFLEEIFDYKGFQSLRYTKHNLFYIKNNTSYISLKNKNSLIVNFHALNKYKINQFLNFI